MRMKKMNRKFASSLQRNW